MLEIPRSASLPIESIEALQTAPGNTLFINWGATVVLFAFVGMRINEHSNLKPEFMRCFNQKMPKFRFAAILLLLTVSLVSRAQTNISFKTILVFDGTNGAMPEAALTLGKDGDFYGTTRRGGKYDKGTIFRFTTNETLRTIFSFDGTNAGEPFAELVQGRDGKLFGTCRSGDVFSILTDGSNFKCLRHFAYENTLLTGITLGPNGGIYGWIPYGGTNREGAIFRETPDGDFKIVLSLDYQKTGTGECELIWGQDGFMYGLISGGGKYGLGNFFRLTTNGEFTILASMDETNSVRAFYNDLIQGRDGGIYGTTQFGGEFDSKVPLNDGAGNGYFFKVTTNGISKTLASFSDVAGAHPQGRLIQAHDGYFYGVTFGGTIFRANYKGDIIPIYRFSGPNRWDSVGPCGLTLAKDGKTIYGTTTSGTIFKFSADAKNNGAPAKDAL